MIAERIRRHRGGGRRGVLVGEFGIHVLLPQIDEPPLVGRIGIRHLARSPRNRPRTQARTH
jgi:hypothetical protein